MLPHDHAISLQCLRFTAPYPFFLHSSRFGHPISLLTLSLAPHSPLLSLFFYSLPFLFHHHLSKPTELSIHYSISYLIVCAVWFVVYLNLSFLSHVVDRGGNKTVSWILISFDSSTLEAIFGCLEGLDGPDGR